MDERWLRLTQQCEAGQRVIRDAYAAIATAGGSWVTDFVVGLPEMITSLVLERDAALAERDHYKGIVEQEGGQEVLWLITRDATVAALTEARRVLRLVEWRGWATPSSQPIGGFSCCPVCASDPREAHGPDCALAAVLAQEEPS